MDPILRSVCPQEIALDVDALNKRDVLAKVASLCERSQQQLAFGPIFRALWRREEAGSTGLGYGVAIPHARIAGLAQPITLYARTRIAVDFDAPDAKPVSQFFAILVPSEANDQHLELLARVAEMLSDRALRKGLAAAATVQDARHAFERWIARHCESNGEKPDSRGERP